MTVRAEHLMSADDFLVWCLDQEGRWELEGGLPVRAMPGASQRHDRIVVNLLVALKQRLRGGPCTPSTAYQASRMANGNVRRPDVTIDCGPMKPDSLEATAPTVFFEVLSPSTRRSTVVKKADEYRALPGLQHFVFLERDRAAATVWTREGEGWSDVDLTGEEAELALAAVGVRMPLGEAYEGV